MLLPIVDISKFGEKIPKTHRALMILDIAYIGILGTFNYF